MNPDIAGPVTVAQVLEIQRAILAVLRESGEVIGGLVTRCAALEAEVARLKAQLDGPGAFDSLH